MSGKAKVGAEVSLTDVSAVMARWLIVNWDAWYRTEHLGRVT